MDSSELCVSRAQRVRRGYRMRLEMEAEPADGSTCREHFYSILSRHWEAVGGGKGGLVWGEDAIKREE